MSTTRRPLLPLLARTFASPYTEPFWEAAKRHELVCQRCSDCGAFRMPPVPYCWRCQSGAQAWKVLPGTGTIFSYTVVNYSLTPDVRPEDLPYTVVVIELDGTEGNRFIGLLDDEDAPTTVAVDARVHVVWDDQPEVTVPRFRLMR